ncbi:MAG: tripartite tricarboxylate transporter TctB family protein [Spirochaetaceae bacterium]|nr:MAG: tripartite tricarboxylate transporter TctB family protein [Spirochaetaceae bacterium]
MQEQTDGRSDVIVGLILTGVAVLFFVLSFSLPVRRAGLSPTTFPRFVTTVMFVLSVILVTQGVAKYRRFRADLRASGGAANTRNAHSTTSQTAARRFALRLILLSLLGIGYTRVIGALGFTVATPLMIAGTMVLFDERKWYRIVLVAVMTTVILYSLFRLLFRVPLPRFDLW